MPDPFEPSLVRRGLNDLLAFYPHLDLISIEWQVEEVIVESIPMPMPIWGPWVLVKLGQASEGMTPAWAMWYFTIWRNTGAVHTMRGPGGEVSDDPIFAP